MRLLKIYDLGQISYQGMPTYPMVKPEYNYSLRRRHIDTYRPQKTGKRSGSEGIIVTSEHVGTHIDALCHEAFDLEMYGGIKVNPENETMQGYAVLGAETIPPIVARGVLLDVAALKGVDVLPEKYSITRDDVEACCRREGVTPRKGDVVLVRTGVGKLWYEPKRYMDGSGVGKEANLWLASKEILAMGADNFGWDTLELDPESGSTGYAHTYLIPKKGIYILENLYLEEIASDKLFTFLFVAGSPKLKGATGAPIRPVAIKFDQDVEIGR